MARDHIVEQQFMVSFASTVGVAISSEAWEERLRIGAIDPEHGLDRGDDAPVDIRLSRELQRAKKRKRARFPPAEKA